MQREEDTNNKVTQRATRVFSEEEGMASHTTVKAEHSDTAESSALSDAGCSKSIICKSEPDPKISDFLKFFSSNLNQVLQHISIAIDYCDLLREEPETCLSRFKEHLKSKMINFDCPTFKKIEYETFLQEVAETFGWKYSVGFASLTEALYAIQANLVKMEPFDRRTGLGLKIEEEKSEVPLNTLKLFGANKFLKKLKLGVLTKPTPEKMYDENLTKANYYEEDFLSLFIRFLLGEGGKQSYELLHKYKDDNVCKYIRSMKHTKKLWRCSEHPNIDREIVELSVKTANLSSSEGAAIGETWLLDVVERFAELKQGNADRQRLRHWLRHLFKKQIDAVLAGV